MRELKSGTFFRVLKKAVNNEVKETKSQATMRSKKRLVGLFLFLITIAPNIKLKIIPMTINKGSKMHDENLSHFSFVDVC